MAEEQAAVGMESETLKRLREDEEEKGTDEPEKKPKQDEDEDEDAQAEDDDEGVEEEDDDKENCEEEKKREGPVKLGPKTFNTAVEMVDYFFKLLHYWPLNLNLNQYEMLVLRDLLLKGHHDAENKIGPGLKAFQVRLHPKFENRCFYFVRTDDVVDDFSYRKCVDSLIPLPGNMSTSGNGKNNQKHHGHQQKHGRHGGKGRGRGRGRGRAR